MLLVCSSCHAPLPSGSTHCPRCGPGSLALLGAEGLGTPREAPPDALGRLARALGAHGERVEKPSELEGALRRALENAPALVDVVTSQSVLSSDAQKGLGFVPDFQALTAWDDAERKRREPQ